MALKLRFLTTSPGSDASADAFASFSWAVGSSLDRKLRSPLGDMSSSRWKSSISLALACSIMPLKRCVLWERPSVSI